MNIIIFTNVNVSMLTLSCSQVLLILLDYVYMIHKNEAIAFYSKIFVENKNSLDTFSN